MGATGASLPEQCPRDMASAAERRGSTTPTHRTRHVSGRKLAGIPSHRVNLSGDWWASWQNFTDDEEIATCKRSATDSKAS